MVPSVQLALAGIAAALLILSLACALLAARPSGIHYAPPAQLFLLSHIAPLNPKTFVENFKNASFESLMDEALESIHGKAVYATRNSIGSNWR